MLAIAVVAQLHVNAFLVLRNRIGQTALATHLVVQHVGTSFHEHVAVLGEMAFNFLLRNVRTKDVHGFVIRIVRHGQHRRGIRLTEVSDGSNTISPGVPPKLQ